MTLAELEQAVPALAEHVGDADLLLPSHPYLRRILLWGPTDRAWARHVDVLETGEHPVVTDALVEAIEAEVVPADWAQVTSTSGSSALPKGVVHSQHNLLMPGAVRLRMFTPGKTGAVEGSTCRPNSSPRARAPASCSGAKA